MHMSPVKSKTIKFHMLVYEPLQWVEKKQLSGCVRTYESITPSFFWSKLIKQRQHGIYNGTRWNSNVDSTFSPPPRKLLQQKNLCAYFFLKKSQMPYKNDIFKGVFICETKVPKYGLAATLGASSFGWFQ